MSSLDYLRLLPFLVAFLVLWGIFARRSPASFSFFPWVSLGIFLFFHLYSSSLGESAVRIGFLLTFILALGFLSRRPVFARILPFVFIFALDWFKFLPALAGIRPAPGFSYLSFRLQDAWIALFGNQKDTRSEKMSAEKLRALALQAFAFPVLFAGPVILAGQFRVIREPFNLKKLFYRRGVFLLFLGILKLKAILPLWEAHFETGLLLPLDFSQTTAFNLPAAGFYQYVRLYLDFSGYTDIVVGLCALLGLKIRHNFNRPYLAESLSDFWRRWHITLAWWVRRHVYIPLGGSRAGNWKRGRNLVFCMVLIGIWHGLAVHFLVWGLLHGLMLVLEKFLLLPFYARLGNIWTPAGRLCGWVITQVFVTLTWTVFFLN